ncbi:MAG: hypothetical protein ABSE98_00115, partial [Acidimicrobiales bacterium]
MGPVVHADGEDGGRVGHRRVTPHLGQRVARRAPGRRGAGLPQRDGAERQQLPHRGGQPGH